MHLSHAMIKGNFLLILADIRNAFITKTRLFKYIENFTIKKGNFSDKKF